MLGRSDEARAILSEARAPKRGSIWLGSGGRRIHGQDLIELTAFSSPTPN